MYLLTCIFGITLETSVTLKMSKLLESSVKIKYHMKSLKTPKGLLESVNRRRTDNTMAKRKSTNNDHQNIHIKLKIE